MIAVRSLVVTAPLALFALLGASLLVERAGRNDVRRGYRAGPATVARWSSAGLAGEGLVEHLLGDGAGEAPAGAGGDLGVGALDHDGDGVARGIGRGVGDDPRVRPLRLA